jgi:hypothetical protein
MSQYTNTNDQADLRDLYMHMNTNDLADLRDQLYQLYLRNQQ